MKEALEHSKRLIHTLRGEIRRLRSEASQASSPRSVNMAAPEERSSDSGAPEQEPEHRLEPCVAKLSSLRGSNSGSRTSSSPGRRDSPSRDSPRRESPRGPF